MENVKNYVGITSEKQTSRLNNKLSKLEAKEMQQVANEKTLAKNLSTTRQKAANINYLCVDDLKAQFIKHVNFCNKKRKSIFCGFDATAIKKAVNDTILFDCMDERGLNVVKCVSVCVGVLEKQVKEMKRKQEKEAKK
jgi:hypothetical protein